MLILSTQVNMAVFAVFLTLEVTEIVLCIGIFALAQHSRRHGSRSAATSACSPRSSPGTPRRRASRTACGGKLRFPVGTPLIKLTP